MPQSSQEIEWPSSQPAAPLTGAQQRLKDIQDALAGKSVSSEKDRSTLTHKKEPLASSKTWNKRLSEPPTADLNPAPQKKARKLPDSWSAAPEPKVQRSSSSATKHSGIKEAYVLSSTKDKKRKVASVFLSQEQTRILQLVQDGESVFYTGSAGTGKSVLLREIIKTLKKKWPNSSDAIAITASTGTVAKCVDSTLLTPPYRYCGLQYRRCYDPLFLWHRSWYRFCRRASQQSQEKQEGLFEMDKDKGFDH
ncbi:hypothetical protein ARMGADRAFT_919184 [Armillaria gallica]|uniref:ATP-dependent DNA helicase n=1 Tax=Armillaria gallica TaxID=47427 RepID=A0A2H3DZM2_ARMGA|nr:hypothetical protein ARMGADRAFT_919184 [Armillaria gallica]